MPVRVLHLSTYGAHGGAGRAASALHEAESIAGIQSSMVVAQGADPNRNITEVRHSAWRVSQFSDRQLWRLQRSPWETWHSPARFGSLPARWINNHACDVVNLHWITDGFMSVEEIGHIDKPIVWSMYDMWPFTGTEHYARDTDDARWTHGYTTENRPPDERGMDIDRWTYSRKVHHWKDMMAKTVMVPASTWLESATTRSALMSRWSVRRIPHVVDTTMFAPIPTSHARTSLGLTVAPGSTMVLFLASGGVADSRKGWDLLEAACAAISPNTMSLSIVVAGPRPPEAAQASIQSRVGHPVIWLGPVGDSQALRLLYCSADVVAVPSRQDNMPLTAMEAQSCNIPVVGFTVGGLPDIVSNGQTGVLSPDVNAEGLARALLTTRDHDFASAPREHALATWSPSVVSKQYSDVYASLL